MTTQPIPVTRWRAPQPQRRSLPSARAQQKPLRQRIAAILDTLVFGGLCAVLLFGVLAFGAVEGWALFSLQVATGVLGAIWSIGFLLRGNFALRTNPIYGPMALFGLLMIVQFVGSTAYRYATATEFFRYAMYAILAVIAVETVYRETRCRFFLMFLSMAGAAIAVFAIVQNLTASGKMYWLVRQPSALMYGPFVNHNHYAGLMEMLAPIPLVMVLMNNFERSARILLVFAWLLMSGTVFLSLSRGGMVSFTAQMLVLGAFLVGQKGKQRKGNQSILWAGVVLALIGFLFYMGRAQITDRVTTLQSPLTDNSIRFRLSVAKDSLHMLAERPIVGWGLGTFSIVYPQYRSFYSKLYLQSADNDYAQLAVESGVAGLLLAGWFVWIVCRSGAKAIGQRAPGARTTLAAAAFIGVLGILIHSASDSNLHVPGNASLFYVLSALTAGLPIGRVAS